MPEPLLIYMLTRARRQHETVDETDEKLFSKPPCAGTGDLIHYTTTAREGLASAKLSEVFTLKPKRQKEKIQ